MKTKALILILLIPILSWGSKEVDMLNHLSDSLMNIDREKSEIYANQAFEMAKKEIDKKGMAVAYDNLSMIEYLKGEYYKSIVFAKEAYRIKEILKDEVGMGISICNMGHSYMNQGNYTSVLDAYFKGLELFSKNKDTLRVAKTLRNIGRVYYHDGKLDFAVQFADTALVLFKLLNYQKGILASYSLLSVCYQDLQKYDMALDIMNYIVENTDSKDEEATNYMNIGIIYYQKGDYEKSIEYHEKAYKIFTKLGRKDYMARITGEMGLNYVAVGNKKLGLSQIENAIEQCLELKSKLELQNTIINKSEAYRILGDSITYKSLLKEVERIDSLDFSEINLSISKEKKETKEGSFPWWILFIPAFFILVIIYKNF